MLRLKHLKEIARPWWLLVAAVWSLFWIADEVISKWGGEATKCWWQAHTEHLPTSWRIWLIGLLAIAVILVVEGSYRQSTNTAAEYQREVKELNREIAELKNRLADAPLIRLADGGFYHDMRPLVANGTVVIANLSCLHAKFKNDPPKATVNSEAKNVLAEVIFFDSVSGKKLCPMIYARWGDAPQPPHLPPGQTPAQNLATINFGIGQERELDIAFKYPDESDCFGMSNETYSYGGWRHPKQKLSSCSIRARVRLRGVGVDRSWDFWFENPVNGNLKDVKQQAAS